MRDDLTRDVLVVDDDPRLREILARRWEEAGFNAQEAEDGIGGIKHER